jgi:hypothetical protein
MMQNPTASSIVLTRRDQATIWAGVDRVVACDADGTVVGTFATVAAAERAIAGSSRGWFTALTRRPRYARSAA